MEPSTSRGHGLTGRPPTSASHPPAQTRVALSTNLSFAQRKARLARQSESNIITTAMGETDNMLRPIGPPLPGDNPSRSLSVTQTAANRRRSAYWENEFAADNRDPDLYADRVRGESLILAELRTNVIIHDELTTINDLSYHLSQRYQRSTSSIVINMQHGCCMMFAGSFEPAYTLTITALPSLVKPITNKRNALLIQNHMREILGVLPSRGHLRFVATDEEDLAVGGKTVAAEIEDQEKAAGIRDPSLDGSETSSKPAKSRRLSLRNSFIFGQATAVTIQPLPTPPGSTDENVPMISMTIPEDQPMREDKVVKTARRKSFVTALFSSKGSVKENRGMARERRPRTSGA